MQIKIVHMHVYFENVLLIMTLILCKSLETNHTLEELYLTDIQISDIGVQTLAKSLLNKTN